MIEAVLLQIPSPVREVLWVRVAYQCNCLVYAKHVLLHHLVVPLLNLIQSPYHSIIIALVAECPLHVHQQVAHRDVLALIQHVGPFAWVPTETGEDVGAHTSPIILLKKGIYIKVPERVSHLHPWIGQLEDRHIQSHGCQLFPLPTPSVASAPMPVARSLTHSGVSIRVWHPLSREGGGKSLPPTVVYWDFGGLPHCHTAPVRGVSLASVPSPILEVLPSCRGALPTSWLEESDSHAAPTGVLRVEFSARLLSLQQSEAVTDHHHASIIGRRLMLKWAEREIHSEKASSMWVRTAFTASCPKP